MYFIMGKPGAHGKYMATRWTFAYKGFKKGRIMIGKGTICHWWIWDSFLQMIDSEAGTRMSGYDWMDLIN